MLGQSSRPGYRNMGTGERAGPALLRRIPWCARMNDMHEAKNTWPREYRELEIIELPEDMPEIGVKAGHPATVVDRHEEIITVDVSDESGRTLDLLDVKTEPELKVIGRWYLDPGCGRDT